MSTGQRPLVSVGVPVYNAERFLACALESLLNQSLSDIEVIISDNASTDRTRAICDDFLRRDRRVRYVRQETNVGIPRNWNALVPLARGEFFKWASANDYCASSMLTQCVDVMQADPRVVLCYGQTAFVDEADQPLRVYTGDIDVTEGSPSERFLRVCTELLLNSAQSGVIRLETLRRTSLARHYPSGDMTLTEELALHGNIRVLPEVLLFRREGANTHTWLLPPLELQRVLNPQAKSPMKLIRARRHIDRFRSIWRAPIATAEKGRASWCVLKLMHWDREELFREARSLLIESTGVSE